MDEVMITVAEAPVPCSRSGEGNGGETDKRDGGVMYC